MDAANLPEAAGYVRYEPVVRQHVVVRGGNNWDLSRSAVATPVSPYAPPALHPGAQNGVPLAATVFFAKNSSSLTPSGKKELLALEKGIKVRLSAFASADEASPKSLTAKRMAAVKAQLASRKIQVAQSGSYLQQEDGSDARYSRKVEIQFD